KQKPKPRGTDDEVCMLICLRRNHAREALITIAEGLSHSPYSLPTFSLLLEYLSNMVPTLELMLKLLSEDWNSHEVDEMTKKVFGQPHPNLDFMSCLKEAVYNQKFLYTPSADPNNPNNKTIAHYIPEMENFFIVLRNKVAEKYEKHS